MEKQTALRKRKENGIVIFAIVVLGVMWGVIAMAMTKTRACHLAEQPVNSHAHVKAIQGGEVA